VAYPLIGLHHGARCGHGDANRVSSMYRKDAPRSGLPSLMLPCTQCGHRMIFTSVEPSRLGSGAASNDLEDITYSCVQCGTTLTARRVRLPPPPKSAKGRSNKAAADNTPGRWPWDDIAVRPFTRKEAGN
jgi:DNA-directed RNA polymerase subunit RPC12/RpoP